MRAPRTPGTSWGPAFASSGPFHIFFMYSVSPRLLVSPCIKTRKLSLPASKSCLGCLSQEDNKGFRSETVGLTATSPWPQESVAKAFLRLGGIGDNIKARWREHLVWEAGTSLRTERTAFALIFYEKWEPTISGTGQSLLGYYFMSRDGLSLV